MSLGNLGLRSALHFLVLCFHLFGFRFAHQLEGISTKVFLFSMHVSPEPLFGLIILFVSCIVFCDACNTLKKKLAQRRKTRLKRLQVTLVWKVPHLAVYLVTGEVIKIDYKKEHPPKD